MRSGAPFLFVALACAGASATAPLHASIVLTESTRFVEAFIHINSEGAPPVQQRFDATDNGPFNQTALASQTIASNNGTSTATQNSAMDATSITALGDASSSILANSGVLASGAAVSFYEFIFSIDQAGLYSYDAAVETTAVGFVEDSSAFVELLYDGNPIQSLSVSGNDADRTAIPLLELVPGDYALRAVAAVEISRDDQDPLGLTQATASFEASLVFVAVPEPASLAVLLIGVPLVWRPRRRR